MAATVVLVHGAFYGAWCWERVQHGLRAREVESLAIDWPGHGASSEPLGDLAADAAAVRDAINACAVPVVVCGHSFGGAVISEGVPTNLSCVASFGTVAWALVLGAVATLSKFA